MKKVFTLGALLLLLAVTVSAQIKKVGMLIGSESVSAIRVPTRRLLPSGSRPLTLMVWW